MDGVSLQQSAFSRGEVSPAAAARTDQELYAAALKTCRNFLIGKTGGAFNRPGTDYIADLQNGYLDMTGEVNILIPFRPEEDEQYVLWINERYIVPFVSGDWVSAEGHEGYCSGAGCNWNFNDFLESGLASSFRSLIDDNKNNFPTTGASDGFWEDTNGKYYLGWRTEFLTEESVLRYTQSVDRMYLSCAESPPTELTRVSISPNTWTLNGYNFKTGPFLDLNTEMNKYIWASAASGDISLYHNSDALSADDIGGLIMLEGASDYGIARITGYSGSSATATVIRTIPADCIGAANAMQIRGVDIGDGVDTTTNITGAVSDTEANYVVVFHDKRIQSGPDASSYIYETTVLDPSEYTCTGTTTDICTYDVAPPNLQAITIYEIISAGPRNTWRKGSWSPRFGWPEISAFYGDRLSWARNTSQPETVWMTQPGDYANFSTSEPAVASDAITFTINSRKSSKIQDLIPLSQLLITTASQAWRLSTGLDNPVAPDTLFLKPDFAKGARDMMSELMDDLAVFVQNLGATIIAVNITGDTDKYECFELGALAEHLLKGYTIRRLAFQEEPFSTLWAVRSDGVLLGFTYMKEFNVLAWHKHDTGNGDQFLDVAVINEDGRDTPYFLVRRTVDDSSVVYLERMHARYDDAADAEDFYYVDCGITYDGRNTTATKFMTLTGSGWTTNHTLTLTASGSGNAPFLASHINDKVYLEIQDADGNVTDRVRVTITARTSTTVVSVVPNKNVPTALRGVATANWVLAVDTISGLDHLEGRTVSVLSDGNEQSSKVVSSGSITLDEPGGMVHVGLPIVADLETLEVNIFGQETIRDKKKTVPTVSLVLSNTRGLMVGEDEDHLEEVTERNDEDYENPPDPATGTAIIPIDNTWNNTGRIFMRQSRPLPATVAAVIPRVVVGG